MPLLLSAPIATYFEVSNGADAARLTDCFTQDALVLDEGRTHRGHAAIRSWLQETRERFEYSVTPLSVSQEDARVTVAAKVSGNFPGSPVQLHHIFQLAGDKIHSLEIR